MQKVHLLLIVESKALPHNPIRRRYIPGMLYFWLWSLLYWVYHDLVLKISSHDAHMNPIHLKTYQLW